MTRADVRHIVAVGHIGNDVLVTNGQEQSRTPGGALLHFAVAAAVLGGRFTIASVVDPTEGTTHSALEILRSAGIRLDHSSGAPTTFRIEYGPNQETASVAVDAPSLRTVVDRCLKGLDPTDLLHLCPLPPEDLEPLLSSRYRSAQLSLQTHASILPACFEVLLDLLDRTETLFLSEEELQLLQELSGRPLEGLVSGLPAHGRLVVTSPESVRVVSAHGPIVLKIDPLPEEVLVDRTGAGDAFAGALLAGEARSFPTVIAVRLAASVAAGKLLGRSSEELLRVLFRSAQ